MSDYTPTTDIIHACYLACTNWESYEGKSVSEVSKEVDAQFDRWLAQVKAQEREHVIKKLAAHALDRTILTAIVDLIEGEEQ